jgi:hypothetical protein
MSKQATIEKGYKKSRVKLSLSTTRRHTGGVPRYVLEDRKIYYSKRNSNLRPSSCSSTYTVLKIERTTCLSHATECTHRDVCNADLIKQDRQ